MSEQKSQLDLQNYLKIHLGLDDAEADVALSSIHTIQTWQQTIDVWGHGVETEDTAQKILENGLHTNWKTLQDIAYRLPENSESLVHKLRGWDYQARKYILLIATPKELHATDYGGYESRQQSIRDSNEHIFESTNGQTTSRNAQRRIPPSKIIGYIDGQNLRLVENHETTLATSQSRI